MAQNSRMGGGNKRFRQGTKAGSWIAERRWTSRYG